MSGPRDFNNDFMNPDYEPGEFDQVERQLRRALDTETQIIEPSDRLGEILRGAGHGSELDARRSMRRWLAPMAAAAAVALIAGTAWLANQGGDGPQPPAGQGTSGPTGATTNPQTSASSAPSSSATTQPSGTGSASSPPVGSASTLALPVYFVGPEGGNNDRLGLYRDFIRATVAAPSGDAQKAKAALVLALNAQPYSNTDGYLQPWSGTTVGDVRVTPSLISIDLSSSGAAGFTAEGQRLAVQELVWTAQAAVGKGLIPVKFSVADGSTSLFGRFPTSQTYNRPATRDEYYLDLADLWINSPSRDEVLPAGKPVTITGEASVFEATFSWQVKKGLTEVKSGTTTASIGAPSRGTYSISVGVLPPGDYSIRVFEISAADGSKIAAERTVSFSVK